MVNEDLKREIKSEFLKGLEDSLSPGSEPGSWYIKECSASESTEDDEFFVLTISSQLFRIFVLLHFNKSNDTEQYISDVLKVGANGLDEEKFYDYLGEVGNGFCGAMKRELNKIVPSLGMSTPNKLNRECIKYINALKVDYETHAIAEYNGTPLFHASAYVCADEELKYEVSARQNVEDEVDSGELEFF